jgi:hypothetical protein
MRTLLGWIGAAAILLWPSLAGAELHLSAYGRYFVDEVASATCR